MRISVLLVAALLAAFSATARADIYRYTDSAGELHFVDDVAKVPKKYRKQLNDSQPLADISVTDAAPVSNPSPKKDLSPRREAGSSESTRVELFITSWCGYCKKMVRVLTEKGIPFTAYDIEKDADAARTWRELGGRGVPVARIGTHVVHGYNPDAVISFLDRQ